MFGGKMLCKRQAQFGTLFMESFKSPNTTIVVTYLKVMLVIGIWKYYRKSEKISYCYIPGNDYANSRDLTKSEMSLKQMINHPTCLINN